MNLDQIPIGRFSQITRLSKKALRLYDKRGILVPAIKDPLTNYRYYSMKQIERGLKIKVLSWTGFGLTEILSLLEALDNKNREKINVMFKDKLKEVQEEIKKLQLIENLLLNNQGMDTFYIGTTNPIVKPIPSIRVISKREMGTHQKTIEKLVKEIVGLIKSEVNQREYVKIIGPPIYICHDRSYKEINADIEIAIPITGRITIEEGFEVKILSECNVVSTISKGPYATLGMGYARIFHYAEENNIELAGPSRQIFINNPQDKKDEQLITEIQLPIK